MRANQIRLFFSSIAYVLLNSLRRLGLAESELSEAQCEKIRLKVLKICQATPKLTPWDLN